jgi:hypothetical protein
MRLCMRPLRAFAYCAPCCGRRLVVTLQINSSGALGVSRLLESRRAYGSRDASGVPCGSKLARCTSVARYGFSAGDAAHDGLLASAGRLVQQIADIARTQDNRVAEVSGRGNRLGID